MRMLKRAPTLSIGKKLKEKQGLYFRKPVGGLRKNPRGGGGTTTNNDGGGDNSEEDDDDNDAMQEKAKEEQKKKEEKAKKKEKPPSTKEVRDWIKSMIEIHTKMVEEEDPSLFPILKKRKKRKGGGVSKRGDSQVNSGMVRNRPITMQGVPIQSRRASSKNNKYLLAHEAGKVLQ